MTHWPTLSYLPIPIFQANNLTLNDCLIQHGHVTGTWQMRPSCEVFVPWTPVSLSLQGCNTWSRDFKGFTRLRSCHLMTRGWQSRERGREFWQSLSHGLLLLERAKPLLFLGSRSYSDVIEKHILKVIPVESVHWNQGILNHAKYFHLVLFFKAQLSGSIQSVIIAEGPCWWERM